MSDETPPLPTPRFKRIAAMAIHLTLLRLAARVLDSAERAAIDEIGFWPGVVHKVTPLLSDEHRAIYEESMHIDDFGQFKPEAFRTYVADLVERLEVEIESDFMSNEWRGWEKTLIGLKAR